MKTGNTRDWLCQADTKADFSRIHMDSGGWCVVIAASDRCGEHRSHRLAVASKSCLREVVENHSFMDRSAAELFRQTRARESRYVPQLTFRRFLGVDSDGIRSTDRKVLLEISHRSGAHQSSVLCRGATTSLHAYLSANGLLLVRYLSVCRYSERPADDFGLCVGHQVQDDGDSYWTVFSVHDGHREAEDRMQTMTKFLGKRIVNV